MNVFTGLSLGTPAVVAVVMASGGTATAQPSGDSSLERWVAAEAQALDFSGVVSIAGPRGNVILVRGLTGDPGTRPNDLRTRFNLASAGKMFTAVAVAQLVDRRTVRLEDPLGKFVKGLSAETSVVTVRQLLTHSSGLGNFFSPQNREAIERSRTVSDLLSLVRSEKPSFPPGSRFQYSNTGFLLLGALVEGASGQAYGDYLRRHIFEPAGMVATGLEPSPESPRAIAAAHPSSASHSGNPAGGAYGTEGDLQRFFAALREGRLTSAAMLKELTSKQITGAPPKEGMPPVEFGLGFGTGAFHGRRWFGHNGGAPGANTETAAFDDGTTVIVLSNQDPPAATTLFRKIREALFLP